MQGHFAELGRLHAHERRARSRSSCATQGKDVEFSSTPASTTPSSTTTRSDVRRGARAHAWERTLEFLRRPSRVSARRRRSSATSSSGWPSAATSTAWSTPTTGRRRSPTGSPPSRSRPPPELARRRPPAARRPRRRRRRARRRPAAAGSAPRSSGCTPRPASSPARPIGYADEVEALLRRAARTRATRTSSPRPTAASTRCCPASAPLAERYIAWREAQAVPVDKLEPAVALAGRRLPGAHRRAVRAARRRARRLGARAPTSRGRASTTTSAGCAAGSPSTSTCRCCRTALAHLVAHEAYPGHHTEHSPQGGRAGAPPAASRRRRSSSSARRSACWPRAWPTSGSRWCVGPAARAGRGRAPAPARHPLRRRGRGRGAPRRARRSARCGATSPCCCTTTAPTVDDAVAYLERWGLLPRARAEKAVEFLTDPTWRAYISCYVEGLPLCRRLRRPATRPGSSG